MTEAETPENLFILYKCGASNIIKGGGAHIKILCQNPTFIMSLSGSAIVLLYMLTYSLARRCFPTKWRCLILKVSIFFYLFPLHQIKYYIMWGIDFIFHTNLCKNVLQAMYVYDKTNTIFIDREIHYGRSVILSGALLLCLGFISFVVVSHQLLSYRKAEKLYSEHANLPVPPEWRELFDRLKKDLGVMQHVDLKCAKYCKIPMVMGVLHPTVFLPANWNEGKEGLAEYILRHELIHVKHHDILIKFLGLFVIGVHWFNPISYFLYSEICILSEISCDNAVIRGRDDHVRIGYSHALLSMYSKHDFTYKERLSIGLVNSDQISLKRRIIEMKSIKKTNLLLAGITFSFICMAGVMTSFAYNPPKELVTSNYDDTADYFYTTKQSAHPDLGFLPFDDFWIDQDGMVHETSAFDERKICHHIYETNGELGRHKKKRGESCSIVYREALVCTLCGKLKEGQVLSTVNYPTCPHG